MRAAHEALIVIDVQVDFCPGGALAVQGGDEIVPGVNALIDDAAVVVLTQDWHPAEHTSFAVNHPGTTPFGTIHLPYGEQTLWPAHCVIGSAGAAFHPELHVDRADAVIRKGFRPHIDSYSAFVENDRVTPTGLEGYLRTRGITALIFVGLATDFCVAWSAIDAARLGFESTVVLEHSRAIDLDGSLDAALGSLRDHGVRVS
jgi:nicotinamidase/pyrazinamidase